jgi:mycothiol synthase
VAVELQPITDDNTDGVLRQLEESGRSRGGDVVDEAELARLQGQRGRAGWRAVVAVDDGSVVGYAGLVDKDDRCTGDVATLSGPGVLGDLLGWQREEADGRELTVWLRFAGDDEVVAVEQADFEVARRLSVLSHDVAGVEVVEPPDGVEVRSFRMEDLDGMLAVLLDAYDGTPDAGWTRNEITRRRSYPWYRDEDLLMAATPDGRIAGIHWTKRRSSDVGEVYNLAIAPWAQGKGLGRALLTAGMAHVRDWGGERIVLWVDNSNSRAMNLYDSMGFTKLWDDLALR